MRVERTIEINAPPERVYDLVMDPRRLGDWVTIHAGLKDAPDGELRKGSELVQCLKLAGRRFDVHWEVVQAEKPKRVVWEGKGPVHSRAKVVYDLDADGDGKLDLFFPGAMVKEERQFQCRDAATGALKWSVRMPDEPFSFPAVADIDGDGRDECVFTMGKTIYAVGAARDEPVGRPSTISDHLDPSSGTALRNRLPG